MMHFTSPITRVSKIGPKYQRLLERLEIFTVGDLIYHVPRRYNDLSQIKKISELSEDEVVTVKATLDSIDNIYTRSGARLTKAVISDGSGSIDVIWFNMLFLKKSLKVGETYNVSGKVKTQYGKFSFVSPEIEKEGDLLNTGRLVPIYPETAGVSSKWLRTRINDVIDNFLDLSEFLPKNLIKKHKFLEFEKALKAIHFPDNLNLVDEAKRRFAFEEVFLELLRVERRKALWAKKLEGHKMSSKSINSKVEEFIQKLPFKLSESQNKALEAIFDDLCTKHPMNRLLEGDVGSGKTVVAIVSAYFAHLNGYKTLYMAPTEILAKQHYETFKKFFEGVDINISLKTGRSRSIEKDIDIIIGTHALLYIEDEIENVGLIVIDEQQRFGVEQRAKLMLLGASEKIPHLLTMTATPIPRTLALTLYGDLDISSIKPPVDRYKNIKTWIVDEKKREEALKWVADQKVSIFVVCPLIEESQFEELLNVKAAQVEYASLKNGAFKNLNVGLLHGRMKTKEKETAVNEFTKGKLDVLVATPVIEVGIDIPDATIMIIESAERYGLSSLHQLRGRVGRGGQDAYCMLFMSRYSRDGWKRLKNLEKHTEGLKLAQIDMEIRGRGDLYGTRQHGFVNFKVADPSDTKVLEVAKKEAQKYYEDLDSYPKLKEKIEKETAVPIPQN